MELCGVAPRQRRGPLVQRRHSDRDARPGLISLRRNVDVEDGRNFGTFIPTTELHACQPLDHGLVPLDRIAGASQGRNARYDGPEFGASLCLTERHEAILEDEAQCGQVVVRDLRGTRQDTGGARQKGDDEGRHQKHSHTEG